MKNEKDYGNKRSNKNLKKVLFVCTGNSCRSQIAEAIFNKYAKNAISESAGTKPEKEVAKNAVKVLKEFDIDIEDKRPKPFTTEMNNEFDYIVTMGCNIICPITPKEKTIKWNIEDPFGLSIEKYREVRDEIEEKVQNLIKEIE